MTALSVLVLVLLADIIPAHAQQDTTAMLDDGDRVRVWAAGSGISGDELNFQRWQDGTLVLLEPQAGNLTRIPGRKLDRIEVRRRSGGTNFWEGVLVGGGLGVLASTIAIESQGGCGDVEYYWCMIVVSPYTIIPGLVIGGTVGSGIPEYEWIPVETERRQEQFLSHTGIAPGFSIGLRLSFP